MADSAAVGERRRVRFQFCSPKQQDFVLDEKSPALMYSGAFGGGKTEALCLKAIYKLLKYPECELLIVRKWRAHLAPTTERKFLRLFPPGLIVEHNRTRAWLRTVTGSMVTFMGIDDAESAGSLEADAVLVDEARQLQPDDWTMLLGRLRGKRMPQTQIACATNPDTPAHFLYDFFFRQGLGRAITTNTFENRFLSEEYKARMRQFTGLARKRYVDGLWIASEGLVYDAFDPGVHLVDPFPIPASWPRYLGIDFGFHNPFVCLWAAESPDGVLYVYREIYLSRQLVSAMGKQIVEFSADTGERAADGTPVPEDQCGQWADHDAEDRATLNGEGVFTSPAYKDVDTGIQAVYSRLMPDSETGKPRLYFFRNLLTDRDLNLVAQQRPTSTLDEFSAYGFANNGKPRKENDHGMDALRYLVMGVERAPRFAPFSMLGDSRPADTNTVR